MTTNNEKPIAVSLENIGISPNEPDRNLEPANIVDGLFAISRAIHHLAKAVEELDQGFGSGLTVWLKTDEPFKVWSETFNHKG